MGREKGPPQARVIAARPTTCQRRATGAKANFKETKIRGALERSDNEKGEADHAASPLR